MLLLKETIVGGTSGGILGGSAADRVCQPVKKPKTYKNGVFYREMLGSKSFIPLLEKDGKRLIFTIGRKR